MNTRDEFERQVSRAIIQLRLRSPFFATLALFASIKPSEIFATAATNGRDIFINKHFWQHLTADEQLGVMAHEVLHAALLHVARRGTREPLRWNIAADIVVNGIIMAQEGFALPEGAIRMKKLEHLSVEEVYHLIKVYSKLQLKYLDLVEPEDGSLSTAEYAELEQHWRQALQQAQAIMDITGHGTLPAGLQRELGHLHPAQLDWRAYLWRFLVQTPVDFQSYDRRFIGQGLYLDALAGESVKVYIAVDTSGSIGRTEIGQFLSEIQGILGAYPHLEAVLYYADAACYGPYPLAPDAEIPAPKGGGGTDFRPFFTIIDAEGLTPHGGVAVYFTDGYGTFPSESPALPVLWVLSAGGIDVNRVPFGEAVRLIPDQA
ncbi:vWA domain-containing protein [Dictyobacter kobayashii]|uniref:Hydrolase n=1 Tax=Dictyobacter kobayashii TaxID=2014872 RepID=A0A402AZA0_9CHLR|nr:VWA-like domain-containing protein [Dictyobacter kobayashii]GCE24403.1 hydrolase [Dictyobacter kobayashii]